MMLRDKAKSCRNPVAVKSLPTLCRQSSQMENSFTHSNVFHLPAVGVVDTFAHLENSIGGCIRAAID